VSGRNPGQDGGGLTAVRPALPVAAGLAEHLLERGSPPGGQRRDPQCPPYLLAGVPGQVQQGVDLRDRHALGPGGDLDDVVPGLHPAFGQYPQVESRAVMGDQQRGDARIVHPDAHPVTGDPRLGHLDHRRADPVAVADAHLVVGQAGDGEVLPELPAGEVVPAQLLLPVPVGVDLVHEHRPVLPAVRGQIALPVAVDVQPPHHLGAVDGPLPHRRVYYPAAPCHILRQAYIYRQQAPGPPVHDHHLCSLSPWPTGKLSPEG
jgi:hypothetical protein